MTTIDDQRKIQTIVGMEPYRENEYPLSFSVGTRTNYRNRPLTVSAITYHVENFGDHGIGMFTIWSGESIIARMMLRAVESVIYDNTEEGEDINHE